MPVQRDSSGRRFVEAETEVVIDRLEDGVAWVDLAPLADPAVQVTAGAVPGAPEPMKPKLVVAPAPTLPWPPFDVSSFKASAGVCSSPSGPTRFGPSRLCMWLIILSRKT